MSREGPLRKYSVVKDAKFGSHMINSTLSPLGYICLLLVLFNSIEGAWGRVITVSQSALASNDNDGTAEQPLKTIARAIALAKAGDEIVVIQGDYRAEDSGWGPGTIPLTRSGTADHPFRIVASGEVQLGHLIVRDVQHVSIEGFHFSAKPFSTHPQWRDMPHIVRDAPLESQVDLDYFADWETRRPTIEKNFATYFGLLKSLEYKVAIDVERCQNVRIIANTIDGYWAGIQCRDVDRADIRENRISHCVNGIFTWEPRPALRNSRIGGNIISQCLDNGIDLRCDSFNVLIDWNRVTFSGRSHIALLDGTGHCIVRSNTVVNGGFYSETMEFPGSSAINLNGFQDGNVVEFNFVANQIDLTEVDGNGIILDLAKTSASTIVRGNICMANMGSGLNTTASPNAVIVGNLFCKNGVRGREPRNGAGIKLSRDQDLGHSIKYNMIAWNRTAGILSYHTLQSQRRVDHNCYISQKSVPLAWDGYEGTERAYFELFEVRAATGWETQGLLFRWP